MNLAQGPNHVHEGQKYKRQQDGNDAGSVLKPGVRGDGLVDARDNPDEQDQAANKNGE